MEYSAMCTRYALFCAKLENLENAWGTASSIAESDSLACDIEELCDDNKTFAYLYEHFTRQRAEVPKIEMEWHCGLYSVDGVVQY